MTKQIICMNGDVAIEAAAIVGEGDKKGPPKFNVIAYTGGQMNLGGWDMPVVVDLQGMGFGNSLVANLDHDRSKRVGNVTARNITEDGLTLSGVVSAATDYAREVVESSANGFVWQASIEASPDVITEVAEGKTTTVNGREFTGPLYVATKSTLKGFAFVSHGADDNTTATIAASAESTTLEKKTMAISAELKAFIESVGLNAETITPDQLDAFEANFAGKPTPPKKASDLNAGFEGLKAERQRQDAITEYALKSCEMQPHNIEAIKALAEQAIDAKWELDKFRLELLEASAPSGRSIWNVGTNTDRLSNRVLEAAVCVAGRLDDVERKFDDQTLQAAHDRFPQGISLNQLMLLGAEANGYRSNFSSQVNVEAQRAAFGMSTPNQIRASGFSTISIPTILSNVANKFIRRGWDAIDMTPLEIAAVRNVRNFQTITTVSLTGDTEFQKVGPTGEIKHGELGEETYSNKADTYARMLAITRTDYINDDLGALTDVPRKLGRGAALLLNKIFWTKFLNNSAFFTSGRANVNEAVADMTTGGLTATETIFMNQTDPDGNPLGIMPSMLLVPTALKTAALQLMTSEKLKGDTDGADGNPHRGRFTVHSSPYMSNATYTGYSAAAWYMLADPSEMPVIEIAALNGRVEPMVETADAEFNVLGVQMRGYSDVGVELQEYRGGVRADGGAS